MTSSAVSDSGKACGNIVFETERDTKTVADTFREDFSGYKVQNYNYGSSAGNKFPASDTLERIGQSYWGHGAFIREEGKELQIDSFYGVSNTAYEFGAGLKFNPENKAYKTYDIEFDLSHKCVMNDGVPEDNYFVLYAYTKKGESVPLFRVKGTAVEYYNGTDWVSASTNPNDLTKYKHYKVTLDTINAQTTLDADGLTYTYPLSAAVCSGIVTSIRFMHHMHTGSTESAANKDESSSRIDNVIINKYYDAQTFGTENLFAEIAGHKKQNAARLVSPLADTLAIKFNEDVNAETLKNITVTDSEGNALAYSGEYDVNGFIYRLNIKDILEQNSSCYINIPKSVLSADGEPVDLDYRFKINTARGYNKINAPYAIKIGDNEVEAGIKIYNYDISEQSYVYLCATYKDNRMISVETHEIDFGKTPGAAIYKTYTLGENADKVKAFLFDGFEKIQPITNCAEYSVN